LVAPEFTMCGALEMRRGANQLKGRYKGSNEERACERESAWYRQRWSDRKR
jgi:hypothetical protein